jgi:DNA primase
MGRISRETIEQVAAASDIVTVIGSCFPLKRAGTEFRALCPFHQEKSPSFFVSPSKQSYYCFGCGRGGAVFQFLMEYENIDFPEAVRRLATRAGIVIAESEFDSEDEERVQLRKRLLRLHFEAAEWFHRNLLRTPAGAIARDYMRTRALNIDVARNWQIGYAPDSWTALTDWALDNGFTRQELTLSGLAQAKDEANQKSRIYDRFRDRLMFPICSDAGETIGFSGRVLNPEAPGGKYINSPETALFSKGHVLFGLNKSKRPIAQARQVVVLEGQIDLITAFEAGIQNVVAPLGTALTERHAHLLRRFADEVVLFFDADPAGQRAAERALEVLLGANLMVRTGILPRGEDPDSLIRTRGAVEFQDLVRSAPDFFDYQIETGLQDEKAASVNTRVGFARKMTGFAQWVVDDVVRDTLLHRLATRLALPKEALDRLVLEQKTRQSSSGPVTSTGSTAGGTVVRHDIAVLGRYFLSSNQELAWVRRQPWQQILAEDSGVELLGQILASPVAPDDPVSLAAFMGQLETGAAASLAQILAVEPVTKEIGRDFWCNYSLRLIRKKKVQLERIIRLSPQATLASADAEHELKQVLDLENTITDISRLPSRDS